MKYFVSGFTALCESYSQKNQSGVDQLTRTLNEYLSELVEGILGSDGDILKFAGKYKKHCNVPMHCAEMKMFFSMYNFTQT